MRGIRIWHLAALALSVPFLAAAVPSGCTGGLNPNFVASVMGQSGASASVAAPDGFVVLSFFNYTGFTGNATFDAIGAAGTVTSSWTIGLPADRPATRLWACRQFLYEINLTGGTLNMIDPATGAVTQTTIAYSGGMLGNNQPGDPLECGSLVKANIRMINGAPVIDVELVK